MAKSDIAFIGPGWVCAVSFVLVLVLTPPQASADTIAATVLDDYSGLPLAAADVLLSAQGGKTIREVRTDSSGGIRISDLSADRYLLKISKSHYAQRLCK